MRPGQVLRAAGAALLFLTATACERGSDDALRIVVIGESLELPDPDQGPMTAPQAVLVPSVAQGLVRFDARGQIVPGLAERWNVTDDGLSYIFRIATTEWSGGQKVTAQQIARILRRRLASSSANPLADSLGSIEDVVAMTDRVIELRLTAPRPNLLQLLAQPELALVRNGEGTGPFRIDRDSEGLLALEREVAIPGRDDSRTERIILGAAATEAAIALFQDGKADLVLGGTYLDLPLVRAASVPGEALRFDPASGLFGLIPLRSSGPLADRELRQILSQAIDRDALVAAFDIEGLLPRATILEPGLDSIADPQPQPWTGLPLAQRRPALAMAARRLLAERDSPLVVKIALPDGPGSDIVFARLQVDWGALGIQLDRAKGNKGADFRLVDRIAPSSSPAWFLRQFRCAAATVCSEEADTLLAAARAAPVIAQRSALLSEAARLMDDAQVFIPLAAPIRWSLVARPVVGFAGNRFGHHALTDLRERLNPERQ